MAEVIAEKAMAGLPESPEASGARETEGKLAIDKLFFNNLLLLGFEAAALSKKYNIVLNADMFKRSNPKVRGRVCWPRQR